MTFRVPPVHVPRLQGRARVFAWVAFAVIVLIIAVSVYVSLYTDLLWFRSVGYSQVFSRRLTTQVLLFFVFGVLMAAIVAANIIVAYRTRPPFRPMSQEQQQLEQLRIVIHPYRVWALTAVVTLTRSLRS